MAAKTIFLFAIALTLFMLGASHADVLPPPGWHTIPTCYKVINAGDYPSIVLIGETIPISGGSQETYLSHIENNTCINATGSHYKFDGFNIYYAEKSYIDSIGGIQGIKKARISTPGECQGGCYKTQINDSNVHLLTSEIRPSAQYSVNDSDEAQKKIFNYRLTYMELMLPPPDSNVAPKQSYYSLVKVNELNEVTVNDPADPNIPPAPPGNGSDLPPAPPNGNSTIPSAPRTPFGSYSDLSLFDQIMCFISSLFGHGCVF